ncbi:MAG: hypothetical protein HY876_01005, partial [Coriobacteriales bacterium]|nr:hypothetical protein [Coriobacteriales bacterium]
MSATQDSATDSTPRRGGLIALAILLVVVVAVAVGTVLLVRLTSTPEEGSTEPYREAWASAMRKAGVDATLPPSPTELTAYRGVGGHPFEATFTGEEATALLAIYPFTYREGSTTALLRDPRLTFPKTGTIRIETGIESSVQGGDLELEGPVAFGSTEGLTSPGAD